MAALTVWRYGTPLAVDAAELRLKLLRERGALQVHDYVCVSWPEGAPAPRVRHPRRARGAGTGALWGALLGAALTVPVAGLAAGAAAGAVWSRLREAGIGTDFVQAVRAQLAPGTSALFVLSSGADVEQVRAMLAREPDVTLLAAHMDDEARARLERLLAGAEPADDRPAGGGND